ncbi:LysR family transcriptional regulator [Phenylobacterium sp. J426]|uniref:LysR family transcriptional regulator n=1 Tax=Phenylobacterium sp. J426 TaxID=2898439 RepID=UPI002150F36E|nr:LysR family transcriptional regulator [Phenylobacterium sp. J426]MCR5873800.1 LysR family transcriptional regulator [Phenylobacterium sp. J426]
MPGTPDWDLLQSLHAVLEAGTFSAAARLRRLTQPTLGRHIDQLERQLGAPLFLRSPRGLQPTDLALALAPHLADMAAAAGAASRDAVGAADDAVGVVRVAASEVMGVEVLPPILARFRDLHPKIDVEIAVSNKVEDLSRRDADIAVRMARPTQNAIVAKKVGEVGFGFYATPGYVERHGLPQTLDELYAHTLIGFDRTPPPAKVDVDLGRPITRDIFALRTDSDAAQLALLRAGFGIGVCQHQIGRRAGLVQVVRGAFGFRLDIWICMHEALRSNPRMRLMFDHLAGDLAAYAAEAG